MVAEQLHHIAVLFPNQGKSGNVFSIDQYYVILASFPGSSAPERDIEVVHACIIRVPGEPGNEATLLQRQNSSGSRSH